MNNGKNYILFGAGKVGKDALHFLGKKFVKCFCDNYRDGEIIEGLPVIGLEKIRDFYDEKTIVVITSVKIRNVLYISKQLESMGLKFELFENLAIESFEQDKKNYILMNRRKEFEYNPCKEYLIGTDKYASAGRVNSYFWQDLWAAKRIYNNPVSIHFDIGSRLDGFIAHLISYGQKVCMIDIRSLDQTIEGLEFIESDATNLDGFEDESIESLSALCSLEHFGLGRYGDPINPEACFNCFDAIQRKMKMGGNLYISVPIGKECVCFNAHRVFYIDTILKEFDKMQLVEISTCFNDEYEENITDYHRFDEWFDKEGDRMGLFWFKKM